jgi:serine/threonine-protein kinase
VSQDLRSRLSSTLGAAYTLDRELGGGGMSRVFIADETALARKVVVKVLHPELAAAVSVERFRREIQLAARLQHPNIVPVLSAGVSDGLPYYTMPYVEGESLRARMTRGALDAPEAVRILRDVAAALSYSHEHGIVHRDVKPDNVLLARHHALVTDFGVAKALSMSAARPDGAMLTTLGIAMGTPAYMAPEQAAADPAADHRVDIYALGAMAYEMRSGVALFGERSPSALLAALVTERPVALDVRRPGLPPALSALVMRCLEKDPADRPQTADEVLAALDAVSTPSTPIVLSPSSGIASRGSAATSAPRVARRRAIRWPVIAAVLVVLLAGAYFLRSAPPRTLVDQGVLAWRDPLLVADFRTTGGDSSLAAVVTEALRTDLGQSRAVTVVQPSAVRATLLRMQRRPDSPLDAALAREVATREGIKAVVEGDIAAIGSGYLLNARLVAPASGDILAAFRETASSNDDLIDAIDRLSHQLRGKAGESLRSLQADPPLDRVTTTSLDALRKYTEGVRALDVQRDVPRAIALLQEAVRLDTSFAMAYRKLGVL